MASLIDNYWSGSPERRTWILASGSKTAASLGCAVLTLLPNASKCNHAASIVSSVIQYLKYCFNIFLPNALLSIYFLFSSSHTAFAEVMSETSSSSSSPKYRDIYQIVLYWDLVVMGWLLFPRTVWKRSSPLKKISILLNHCSELSLVKTGQGLFGSPEVLSWESIELQSSGLVQQSSPYQLRRRIYQLAKPEKSVCSFAKPRNKIQIKLVLEASQAFLQVRNLPVNTLCCCLHMRYRQLSRSASFAQQGVNKEAYHSGTLLLQTLRAISP